MAFSQNGNGGNGSTAGGSTKYTYADQAGKTQTGTMGNGAGIGLATGTRLNAANPNVRPFQTDQYRGTGGDTQSKLVNGKWVTNHISGAFPTPPSGPAPAAPPPAAQPPAAGPPAAAPPADPGVLGQDGYLEQLYKQRQDGNDPFYNTLRERGTTAINNQAAARGGYNSSGAMNAIGDYQTGIDARQFHDQADLAAAASGERRGRFSDMWDRGMGLSSAHTNAMKPLGAAGDALGNADMQAIQLQLDKSGIDPKVKQQILQNMFGMVGAGATIYGDTKGGGAPAGAPPAPGNPYDDPANTSKYNYMYD